MIKSIGFDVHTTSESDASLCKKCAQNIVRCCALFHELQESSTESGNDATEADQNIIQKVIFDGDQLTED